MASHSASSGGGSSNSGHSSPGQAHSFSGSNSSRQHKLMSVRIQPTIGPSFTLSLPPSTKISTMKENISDKMGLSPQKMTLLLHNNALDSGTLTDNGIDDGSEVRLVPAIESGVTTTNSVDPVAMMKHSMSGISDQQIDDFLNGKYPLSVAIRVGESVVVVNLHRAKVEEIEMEPPPHKKRCVRSRRPSHHDDMEYTDLSSKHGHSSSSSSPSSSSRESYQYLNSNHSASELMRAGNLSPSAAASSGALHRSSRRKSHRTLSDARHHHHHHHHRHHHHHHHRGLGSHDHSPSSASAYPLGQPDRSMLTYTRDTPMETSVAISAPPPMDGPSHPPIPRATPIISKDAPVVTTISPSPSHDDLEDVKMSGEKSVSVGACPDDEAMEVSTDAPNLPCSLSTSSSGQASSAISVGTSDGESASSPDAKSDPSGSSPPPTSDTASTEQCSGHGKSVSRSVQTDPEPEAPAAPSTSTGAPSRERREGRDRSRKENRIASRREIKLPESGISMKRKAVMEAISEILKKMYANTEKGRLPGSFKGRFSSEFTCDSDMREILHSKTTMTSYGSGMEDPDKTSPGEATSVPDSRGANLSKAKLKEQQQLKDKVANLKWRMQHSRAMKMAKRKGERSPCGWMEALNCNMPGNEPKAVERSGYCGLKRGFLLAD